mmetsp:Transcript_23297/g.66786  ORF Transcript_23297/g.66786 Transcript_23297/m.66786 type:complete len:255 (-) Transcript_23297:363-1127(-)
MTHTQTHRHTDRQTAVHAHTNTHSLTDESIPSHVTSDVLLHTARLTMQCTHLTADQDDRQHESIHWPLQLTDQQPPYSFIHETHTVGTHRFSPSLHYTRQPSAQGREGQKHLRSLPPSSIYPGCGCCCVVWCVVPGRVTPLLSVCRTLRHEQDTWETQHSGQRRDTQHSTALQRQQPTLVCPATSSAMGLHAIPHLAIAICQPASQPSVCLSVYYDCVATGCLVNCVASMCMRSLSSVGCRSSLLKPSVLDTAR